MVPVIILSVVLALELGLIGLYLVCIYRKDNTLAFHHKKASIPAKMQKITDL